MGGYLQLDWNEFFQEGTLQLGQSYNLGEFGNSIVIYARDEEAFIESILVEVEEKLRDSLKELDDLNNFRKE